MPFPKYSSLEVPILQEVKAMGGEAELKTLYPKLVPYFPQLTYEDLKCKTRSGRSKWRYIVQRASQALADKWELEKTSYGRWRLTEKGRRRAEAEDFPLQLLLPLETPSTSFSHKDLKRKLVEIGTLLGKYAEEEYHQKYDVVWKEREASPRISHVFEVQHRGKIESALTKLKHAYDTQRSKPFLVLVDRKEGRKVSELLHPYLSGSFHEIAKVTTILSPQDVDKLYHALSSLKGTLEKLLTE
jgi:hypothetical protein